MNAIVNKNEKLINWSGLVLFILGFWLSASVLLDGVIMPCLSVTGMMIQDGFSSAAYVIFGTFNRIELLCGAMVLSAVLVFRHHHNFTEKQLSLTTALATLLLAIAIIYTYILTPQLSGWGLQINFNLINSVNTMPQEMIFLQGTYWLLEGLKLIAGIILLRLFYFQNLKNRTQL
jgi:hypothetical protein